VLFFPEGTTTDGAGVLPFRRGLFHSVLDNGVSLRTAALRYSLDEDAGNRGVCVGEDVCWWGEMGFTSHIFGLLGLQGLRAQMRFGDEVVDRQDRFVLSETAQARVAEMYEDLGGGVSAVVEQPCESALLDAVLN
jgi:1-acyl-sn-glycerol-3-phosphate acyltransferase